MVPCKPAVPLVAIPNLQGIELAGHARSMTHSSGGAPLVLEANSETGTRIACMNTHSAFTS